MSGANVGCVRTATLVDALLDGELDATTRAVVEGHIATCANCTFLVANRKALRDRVRGVVRNAEVPEGLEPIIRRSLQGPPRSMPARHWMALAAAVVLMVGGAFWYRTARAPLAVDQIPEQAMIRDTGAETVPIIQVGLNDHIHCAVYRKYPDSPPALAEMLRDLGPTYADLLPAAAQHAPNGMRVEMAHICKYGEREYVHVIFRGQGRVASLVITARDGTEDLSTALPGVHALSQSLYSTDAKPFRVAAFQTPRHLVYLISDGNEAANEATLQSMTPAVRAALLRIES